MDLLFMIGGRDRRRCDEREGISLSGVMLVLMLTYILAAPLLFTLVALGAAVAAALTAVAVGGAAVALARKYPEQAVTAAKAMGAVAVGGAAVVALGLMNGQEASTSTPEAESKGPKTPQTSESHKPEAAKMHPVSPAEVFQDMVEQLRNSESPLGSYLREINADQREEKAAAFEAPNSKWVNPLYLGVPLGQQAGKMYTFYACYEDDDKVALFPGLVRKDKLNDKDQDRYSFSTGGQLEVLEKNRSAACKEQIMGRIKRRYGPHVAQFW